jgi:hypothetical protein
VVADRPGRQAGLAAWGGLAAGALVGPEGRAGALVGLGWLGHAARDVALRHTGRVAPRGYAEWRAVLDVAVGTTTLLAVLSG